MKYYKTFHGAKRGAIAMAKHTDFDGLIMHHAVKKYFIVRPATFPWLSERWATRICARINAYGQTVN